MTLLQLRTKLVQLTGRFDLVVDTNAYADDGANFFIQAGLRMLDNMSEHGKTQAKIPVPIVSGQIEYLLPALSSVRLVRLQPDAKSVIFNLEHIEEWELDEMVSDTVSEAPPKYWSLATVLTSNLTDTSPALTDLAIKIAPKTDYVGTLEVTGRFRNTLVQNSDRNFWSERYPETLIRAALYQIEVFHRNTQGANDHLLAIQRDLAELDKNLVESEISGSVMRDSFLYRGKGGHNAG